MPIVPTKDRPLNMPCDDPEGCKHFKAELKLQEQNTFHAGREYKRKILAGRITELKKGGYIRHKHNCNMGEYNTLLIGKGCDCGLSQIMER